MTPKNPHAQALGMTVQQIEATHASKGACRHCGGRIPCWSMVGDKVPLSPDVIAKAQAYLAEAKHPGAVALGKLGGQARAAKLSPEARSAIARKAGKLGGIPKGQAWSAARRAAQDKRKALAGPQE